MKVCSVGNPGHARARDETPGSRFPLTSATVPDRGLLPYGVPGVGVKPRCSTRCSVPSGWPALVKVPGGRARA